MTLILPPDPFDLGYIVCPPCLDALAGRVVRLRLPRPREEPRMIGWLGVAAVVVAHNARAFRSRHGESPADYMSTVYRRAFRKRPAVVGGLTAYLVLHLFGWLPCRCDLLGRWA